MTDMTESIFQVQKFNDLRYRMSEDQEAYLANDNNLLRIRREFEEMKNG